MARILITSGPTRQYLDPVRYLTNASSGRMGSALADAARASGHEVVVISGPVEITYSENIELVPVISTEGVMKKFFGKTIPLPKRFLEEPGTGAASESVCELDEMLKEYYAFRGWENGVVPEGKLKELGIIA